MSSIAYYITGKRLIEILEFETIHINLLQQLSVDIESLTFLPYEPKVACGEPMWFPAFTIRSELIHFKSAKLTLAVKFWEQAEHSFGTKETTVVR